MPNNRDDFAPEHRNQAIYSGDARKIVNGRAAEVYLQKTGQVEAEDLSDKEFIQWGLRLQDPIARAVSDRLKVELKELDVEITHPKHNWMRSHFDYVSADSKSLYEIKNYGSHQRNKFGDNGSQDIPVGDLAQLIHEAAVFNVSTINLCVLFGGSELVIYPFEIDDALKEPLILQEAAIWANVQRREPPEASNPDDLRALFRIDSGDSIYATPEISQVCGQLKLIKKDIKLLEEHETRLTGKIQSYLREAAILKEGDKILATWKTAASSNSFSSKLFQQAMPDIYKQFTVETPGSRRLLIK